MTSSYTTAKLSDAHAKRMLSGESLTLSLTDNLKKCSVCKSVFTHSNATYGKTEAQYCSRACKQKAYRLRKKQSPWIAYKSIKEVTK